MEIIVKSWKLNNEVDKLLSEGSKVLEITKSKDEYLVKCEASPVSQKRIEQQMDMSDYERLKRMEKRINVYPDLRRAVRAAMEHDDRSIDDHLNRFREALQETRQRSPSEQGLHPEKT